MASTKRKKRKESLKFKIQSSKLQLKVQNYFIYTGLFLILAGLTIFTLTFYPVIKEELKYQFSSKTGLKRPKNAQIKPVDEEFGIVIPKIGANAKVIANVDPYNEKEYQWQLTKGVAHAKGTSLPGQIGNTFIFAHSSGDWFTANRYNSIFYLLNKLKKGDGIDIYYQKQKYEYKVVEKKIVEANSLDYLVKKEAKKTITLMTCWPPGTTLKRLIVIAEAIN